MGKRGTEECQLRVVCFCVWLDACHIYITVQTHTHTHTHYSPHTHTHTHYSPHTHTHAHAQAHKPIPSVKLCDMQPQIKQEANLQPESSSFKPYHVSSHMICQDLCFLQLFTCTYHQDHIHSLHQCSHSIAATLHSSHSIAKHCKTLQHTATHCNTLQHTATHWLIHSIAETLNTWLCLAQLQLRVSIFHSKDTLAPSVCPSLSF